MSSVLSIEDLRLEFPIYQGAVQALNGVTLRVEPREIVGIVGESGSGKSVTSMAVMRLLVEGSYRVPGGAVTLLGQDVLRASEATTASRLGITWASQRPSVERPSARNPGWMSRKSARRNDR